ncbi:MAG: hypothetical protein GF311_28610 [Candidatus Lokiarchaeota archaeon]|nr:hypothetical protein [Candidatus Lokiarchaeota archaeon]
MSDDNNIISFEEYRRKKRGDAPSDSALDRVLRKDLREQEDLITWYQYHKDFNRYRFFLHSMFYCNHVTRQGKNPNTGFVLVFDPEKIESIVQRTEDALKWLERRPLIIDFEGKTLRQIGESLPLGPCGTYQKLYTRLNELLLHNDYVVVIKGLSLSQIRTDKIDFARGLIKTLDDAHFDNIVPSADLVFVDYASFLQQAWTSIGSYLDILPSDYHD